MAVTDPYATAKTNLRDNVKTLMTVFGAVAGVILAGTPFSGYGALLPWSQRWWLASASLLLAIVLIGFALHLLLRVLQPDLAYPKALHASFCLPYRPLGRRRELLALRKSFDAHKDQLLPNRVYSVEEMERLSEDAWEVYQRTGTQKDKALFEERNGILAHINHWSAYTRFHYRVSVGTDRVLLVGLAALVFIAAFSWAVSSPNPPDQSPTNVLVLGSLTPDSSKREPLPKIEPIPFETGKWSLSDEALAAVALARDYLRSHPESSVLVYGFTDTQGGAIVNRTLAARRTNEVRRALVEEGGISASRVFVAEMPETDLPFLTAQEVPSAANRVVQLMLIPLRLSR